MGAGGSVSQPGPKKVERKTIRTVERSVSPGNFLQDGVGRVVTVQDPLSQTSIPFPEAPGMQYAWFVEAPQGFDQWEPYNDESNSRLEGAFLNQEGTCTVVHNKRTYTVDLTVMEQISCVAGQNSRRVKRGACECVQDPKTGIQTRRLTQTVLADPFEDFEGDALFFSSEGNDLTGSSAVNDQYGTVFPLLKRTFFPFNGPLFNMALSAADSQDGSLIAAGGRNGQLSSWNSQSSRVSSNYNMDTSPTVLNVAYSLKGDLLAMGADDFKARIFREGCSKPLHQLNGHVDKVYGLSFTACGTSLVTGSMDSTLCLWDVESGISRRREAVQSSHIFAVSCSRFQPNVAISAGNDSILSVHDFRSPTLVVMRCAGHKSTVWGCDIRGDDMEYVTCGKDCSVRLWDARKPGASIHVYRNHVRAVHSVIYCPELPYVLSCGRDGKVVCYSPATKSTCWKAVAHAAPVFRVLYNPKVRQMLTCATDGCVHVWDWSGR